MPSESEIIIAFVFNRSGKTALKSSEFYLTLSMDLNWFSPKQAKDLLNKFIKQDLILEENNLIKPSFDYNNIKIPIGFYPSKDVLDEKIDVNIVKKYNIIEELIKEISDKSNMKNIDVEKKIQLIEKEKNITPEISALLLAKEYNINLKDYYKKIEEQIFQ